MYGHLASKNVSSRRYVVENKNISTRTHSTYAVFKQSELMPTVLMNSTSRRYLDLVKSISFLLRHNFRHCPNANHFFDAFDSRSRVFRRDKADGDNTATACRPYLETTTRAEEPYEQNSTFARYKSVIGTSRTRLRTKSGDASDKQ